MAYFKITKTYNYTQISVIQSDTMLGAKESMDSDFGDTPAMDTISLWPHDLKTVDIQEIEKQDFLTFKTTREIGQ